MKKTNKIILYSLDELKSNFSHLNELADGLLKVANVHVRNVASWAGNLALKKHHPEFPSDVLLILEAAGAKLNLFSVSKNTHLKNMPLKQFLINDELKPSSYLIESMSLPAFSPTQVKIKYSKVSPRSQNSHAYINSAFRFEFEPNSSTKLISKPLIAYNGLSSTFYHANKTQDFLNGQDLAEEIVLAKSIELLSNEINESGLLSEAQDATLASPQYRSTLALSLFYKFMLELNENKLKDELKSSSSSIIDSRSVSRAEFKFENEPSSHPVCKPLPKLNAYHQVSGESKYIDDLAPLAQQAHAAFILSEVGRAKIESVAIDEAMKVKGVVRVLLAKDIPGENSIMPRPFGVEPLFADEEVVYCGQPVGLVVADSHETAKKAARLVRVKYGDVKKPILDVFEAMKENSFHAKPSCGDLVRGMF